MKKRLSVTCFTILLSGLLAGCAKEHIWEEATCTTPKTCTECGATEGDVAEHTWTDATCSSPKTCSVCGATEGDVAEHAWTAATCSFPKTCSVCGTTEGDTLQHSWTDATCSSPKTCSACGATEGNTLEHSLTEANYQSAATCAVCGETVGEPLQAAFEEYGIICNAEENVEYDYISICSSDSSKETVGTVVFSDYNTFTSDESHPAKEGYEWKTVTITQTFSDNNANNYGCVGFAPSFDYYSGVDFETIGNTLTYNGTEYAECEVHWSSLKSKWEGQTYCSITQFDFLVPIGYDGIVIASINWANCADNPWVNDSVPAYIDDIDEDSILFRLK